MLLVLDIGNTTTVLGLYREDSLVRSWRLTSEKRTADELSVYLLTLLGTLRVDPEEITGAAMASVVPPLDAPWSEAVTALCGVHPLEVTSSLDLGMPVCLLNPGEVGADRLVNAVAGMAAYGKPLLVVDFGTAVNIDVVDGEGRYRGGALAPGLAVSMEALFGRTAKVPKVALAPPPFAIGRSTQEAVQSGIIFGYAGLVDALVRRMWKELGAEAPVVATGGQASLVASFSETIRSVAPDLTLEGLRLIHRRHRG
ncbi:MAG TPA: type III pantothenate kinase [Synergistaceae bacterium]|nr:type III pantothenate kinase [Synergistaceae bacterium]HQF90552.1 type III pantothenate kinase [Synergistaceae bacterium]HQH77868.1 type III pantothenate kinase [Synergistaceae bacterium]HQK23902.1 type III pantothenate kinase [Synergistaceae bacterium]